MIHFAKVNGVLIQLESLEDDDIGTGYIIKAVLTVVSILAVAAFLICVFN